MNLAPALQFDLADLSPSLAREILGSVDRMGGSAERLCRGLGFRPDDLKRHPEIKVSYRQTRQLVKRFQEALGDKATGLSITDAVSPLSWGLPGLAMLTCRTLGEAAQFCLQHQIDAGAVMTHRFILDGTNFVVELTPRYPDPEFEAFFVEDGFGGIVSVVRFLVGRGFKPERMEFAYPKPPHGSEYFKVFGCPMTFSTGANRMSCSAKWLQCEIQSYDAFTCDSIRGQLDQLLERQTGNNDLVESVSNILRSTIDRPTTLAEVAGELNLSERTLSRRFVEQGVSFQKLVDQIRCDYAVRLLTHTNLRIEEVAAAVGFKDSSNFRRAYKRWTGQLPRR